MDLLDEYTAEDVKGVILDLRGSPGGYLSEMIKIAELFIPPKRILWMTKGVEQESMDRVVSEKAAFLRFADGGFSERTNRSQ